MITESASSTKTPPIESSRISCLMITATVPIAPPSASDPTSPMNISAGCALYQRNPNDAPTSEPQKITRSPAAGIFWISKYSAYRALLERYVSTVNAAEETSTHPIARPSSPSVRFTALDVPTITSTRNASSGTYASAQMYFIPKIESITRSGCSVFKNGTVSCVEYAPCVCNINSTTPTTAHVSTCNENFPRGVSP